MGMGVVERGNVEMGRLIVTYRAEIHLENSFWARIPFCMCDGP